MRNQGRCRRSRVRHLKGYASIVIADQPTSMPTLTNCRSWRSPTCIDPRWFAGSSPCRDWIRPRVSDPTCPAWLLPARSCVRFWRACRRARLPRKAGRQAREQMAWSRRPRACLALARKNTERHERQHPCRDIQGASELVVGDLVRQRTAALDRPLPADRGGSSARSNDLPLLARIGLTVVVFPTLAPPPCDAGRQRDDRAGQPVRQ